ncbi:MAG: TIGR04013 family B12-binding domain/radical SAM domain-containing protein [Magnetospirillum sp. WYHS-4]
MTAKPLFLFNYRRNRAYACHVLLGALEKADLDREVDIRFARGPEALVELIAAGERDGRPVLVAWSFFSPNFAEAVAELAVAKAGHGPGVLHLAGGVHAAALPAETLRAGFDLVATGEGEATIVDLVRTWKDGGDPGAVKGIGRLEGDRYVTAGPAGRVDLDDWPPFAARDGWFNPIEITRGCIYACRFCRAAFHSKARFRHRSVAAVRDALKVMRKRNMRDVRFITPSALSYGADGEEPRLDLVEEFLIAVQEELGPRGRIFFGSFPAEARPEHLTPESVGLLKRLVHNDNIVIGAQSGSPRMLEACHRGHSVDDVFRGTRAALAAGFKTYVDFIFGLPGETAEDARESLRVAEELAAMGARVHAHTFLPLPGTPFAGTPAGTMNDEIRLGLHRLASRGGLFGQWQTQSGMSPGLAILTKTRRSPPAS